MTCRKTKPMPQAEQKKANNLERKMGKEKQQQRDREKISRKKTAVPPPQGDDLIYGGKRKQRIEN